MACHQGRCTAHTEERHQAWHAIIAIGQHRRSDDVERGMPSPPLDITHARMTSGVACHHRPSTTHTEEQRRAWHDLTALGQHTWSEDVGCGMTSPPLVSKQGQTTSGVACHHHLWAAHTVERRRAWHAIIALRRHTKSKDVGRGMTSPPLDSTHGRTTSGVTCHLAFGKHTRSKDVGRGMKSPPLGSTHGQTTSGVACQHRLWAAHSRKTSSVA